MTETFGTYDFGLTQDGEERAARLHAESLIIDMLYQGPCGYRSYPHDLVDEVRREYDVHKNATLGWNAAAGKFLDAILAGNVPSYRIDWEASGVTAGCLETYVAPESAFASFSTWTALFDRNPWLIKALAAEDFRRAKSEGRRAAWLNCQTGVDAPLAQYALAHRAGLRMFQLAYNTMNGIASGCTERTDAGVSRKGAQVIALLNDVGVIVDTSHCGRRTTLDACELSAKPVIASHTGAEALYAHARCKSDQELTALAATGGIVGVFAVPFFLSGSDVVTIDAMLDHVDYIAGLIGPEHVGIGCDWPMQVPKLALGEFLPKFAFEIGFREGDVKDPRDNVVGFDDYRDYPNITRGLVKRGYSDEQVRGILGENFLRVFEAACG